MQIEKIKLKEKNFAMLTAHFALYIEEVEESL
jgi:hypothetical protein